MNEVGSISNTQLKALHRSTYPDVNKQKMNEYVTQIKNDRGLRN